MHPRDLDDLEKADWLTDDLGRALSQLGDSLRLYQACRRAHRDDQALAAVAMDGFATSAHKLIDFLDRDRVGRRGADEAGFEDFVPDWSPQPLGAVLTGARRHTDTAAAEVAAHGAAGPAWHFDEIVAALRVRLRDFLDACGDAGLDVELLRAHVGHAFGPGTRIGEVALELPAGGVSPDAARPPHGSGGQAGEQPG